jgi:pimeloyl-ACP methyl ester carboxylesterase
MGSARERVSVNGVELEFACVGSGEPVVFIHGGGIADTGLPLAAETALNEHYRMIPILAAGIRREHPDPGPSLDRGTCAGLPGCWVHWMSGRHTSSATPTALWWPCGWLSMPRRSVSSLALCDPSPLVVMTSENSTTRYAPASADHG